MRHWRIFKEGVTALNSYKSRTFLMALGTMIGIGALTAILGINSGTERKIKAQVDRFGARAVLILPGHGATSAAVGGKASSVHLKMADAEAIADRIEGVESISANSSQFSQSVKAGRNQTKTTVDGVEASWHDVWDWPVASGEAITTEDVKNMARVCLLGTTVVRELFGEKDPIGETVQIGNFRFKVKGVLESRGATGSAHDRDLRINIPISTAMKRLFNQNHLSLIRVKVKEAYDLDRVGEAALDLLNQRHHIDHKVEKFFTVYSTNSLVRSFKKVTVTVGRLLGVLTALSLLAGGLVMMNILLVSIAERKSEIGLRRAVGATRGDVFFQFLWEALGINIIGLILGWVLGFLVLSVMSKYSSIPILISVSGFFLGGPLALLVALVFGMQPARRAAAMNPVEALK